MLGILDYFPFRNHSGSPFLIPSAPYPTLLRSSFFGLEEKGEVTPTSGLASFVRLHPRLPALAHFPGLGPVNSPLQVSLGGFPGPHNNRVFHMPYLETDRIT